jgi:predicted cupin superfamily sugar epimerase
MTASYYKEKLQLIKHPEGGHYVETFRSEREFIPDGWEGKRSMATSIIFLLEQGEISSMHRIKSDEIWYHHDGGCLHIIELNEAGEEIITRLGKNLEAGEVLQHVVPAGRWFGARPASDAEFVLVGCQVSPGFDFRDFELMNS